MVLFKVNNLYIKIPAIVGIHVHKQIASFMSEIQSFHSGEDHEGILSCGAV
jgi:hypothetical protein